MISHWRSLLGRLTAFGTVGALTTIFGYLTYLFLLVFLSPVWSYILSFALGIFFSAALNSKYTFKTRVTTARMLIYVAFYLASMSLGTAILSMVIEVLRVSVRIAPLVVLVIMVPVNFLFAQRILKDNLGKT